jgi:hypothetical protein
MRKTTLLAIVFVFAAVAVLFAQQRPGVFSTVNTISTSSESLKVGCAVTSSTCTGGIRSGLIASSSTISERSRGFAMGATQTRAFVAGNFTADTGSWTVASGDVATDSYRMVGDTLYWTVKLNNTTTAGPPNELRITLPNSLTAQEAVADACLVGQTSTTALTIDGVCQVAASGTFITITHPNGSAFSAATDDWNIAFTVLFKAS